MCRASVAGTAWGKGCGTVPVLVGHPSCWPQSPRQVTLDTLCIAAGQTPGVIPAFDHLPTLSHAASSSQVQVTGHLRHAGSCRDHAEGLFSRPVITFPNTGTSGLPLRSKH